MANAQGVSHASVARIWDAHVGKPPGRHSQCRGTEVVEGLVDAYIEIDQPRLKK